jgi:hypothetical protein
MPLAGLPTHPTVGNSRTCRNPELRIRRRTPGSAGDAPPHAAEFASGLHDVFARFGDPGSGTVLGATHLDSRGHRLMHASAPIETVAAHHHQTPSTQLPALKRVQHRGGPILGVRTGNNHPVSSQAVTLVSAVNDHSPPLGFMFITGRRCELWATP